MPRLLLGLPVPDWDEAERCSTVQAPSRKEENPRYRPSPEEIREACRRIQEGWSKAERRKRASGSILPVRWFLPSVPFTALAPENEGDD